MILRKFFNNFSEDADDVLVDWLVLYLVAGLVFGLVWGLVFGLVAGEWGLSLYSLINFGVLCFIAMEALYYFYVKNLKKRNVSLWCVLGIKLEQLLDVLLVVVNGINLWWVCKTYVPKIDWKETFSIINVFGGYLIFALVGLGVIILWLWLNKQLAINGRKKK